MEATKEDVENAKKLIAENEEAEFKAVAAEVVAFFKSLNDRGYGMVPAGEFVGNEIKHTHKLVKLT